MVTIYAIDCPKTGTCSEVHAIFSASSAAACRKMNIKNITMENISIQSEKGFVCIEGEDITLRNATLDCKENTAIYVQNSKDLTLDAIRHRGSDVFMQVAGERSEKISVLNGSVRQSAGAVALGAGAGQRVVTWYLV